MRLETYHVSRAGGRAVNEDAVACHDAGACSILALADGLGGHGDGQMAARRCVDVVVETFCEAPGLSDETLQSVVRAADEAVRQLRRQQHKPSGSMRTTVAFLAAHAGDARWVHVGDSRIYWFRDGALMQRTRDHSVRELVMSLADKTIAAPPDPADRNTLLRVIGGGRTCLAALSDVTVLLRDGDAFLLCSDGAWEIISDTDIERCLIDAGSPREWCDALEQHLVMSLQSKAPPGPALARHDNFSMICAMARS
jgi:serine/threonine protein phosphatase PrpC